MVREERVRGAGGVRRGLRRRDRAVHLPQDAVREQIVLRRQLGVAAVDVPRDLELEVARLERRARARVHERRVRRSRRRLGSRSRGPPGGRRRRRQLRVDDFFDRRRDAFDAQYLLRVRDPPQRAVRAQAVPQRVFRPRRHRRVRQRVSHRGRERILRGVYPRLEVPNEK
eukprot:29937-Pelagococcus_subviridis.AAC.4